MAIKPEYEALQIQDLNEMSEVKTNIINAKCDYLKKCLDVTLKSRDIDSSEVVIDYDRNGKEIKSQELRGIRLAIIDNVSLWVLDNSDNDPCKLIEVTTSKYFDDGTHDESVKPEINDITIKRAMTKYNNYECAHSLLNAASNGIDQATHDLLETKKRNFFGFDN